MLTAGVDLAAEPRGTALAVIHWAPATASTPVSARLTDLQLGVADATIVDAASGVDKIGIDCAFGWPLEFVQFVARHSDLDEPRPDADGGMDWRRILAYRETDRALRQRTGRWPLSVSTDRLGLTAMRCAGLLDRIHAIGVPVDRAGTARVVEVYPGASLRLWGFDTAGYRTALAARSAAIGLADGPPPHLRERASVEGWIALPTGALGELAAGRPGPKAAGSAGNLGSIARSTASVFPAT